MSARTRIAPEDQMTIALPALGISMPRADIYRWTSRARSRD